MSFYLVSTGGEQVLSNTTFAGGWPTDPTISNSAFSAWPIDSKVINGALTDWSDGGGSLTTNSDFSDWQHPERLTTHDFGDWSPRNILWNGDFSEGFVTESANDLISNKAFSTGDLTDWVGDSNHVLFEGIYNWPYHDNTSSLGWGDSLDAAGGDSIFVYQKFTPSSIGTKIGWKLSLIPYQDGAFTTWNPRLWISKTDPVASPGTFSPGYVAGNISGNTGPRDGLGDSSGNSLGVFNGGTTLNVESSGGTADPSYTTTQADYWVCLMLPKDKNEACFHSQATIKEAPQVAPYAWDASGGTSAAYFEESGSGTLGVVTDGGYSANSLRLSQKLACPGATYANPWAAYWCSAVAPNTTGTSMLTVDIASTNLSSGNCLEAFDTKTETSLGTIPYSVGSHELFITWPDQGGAPANGAEVSGIELRVVQASSTFEVSEIALRPLEGEWTCTEGFGVWTHTSGSAWGPTFTAGAGSFSGSYDQWAASATSSIAYILPIAEASTGTPFEDQYITGGTGVKVVMGGGSPVCSLALASSGILTAGATYTLKYTVLSATDTTTGNIKLLNGATTALDLPCTVGTHYQPFIFDDADPSILALQFAKASTTIELDAVYIDQQWTAATPAQGPTDWNIRNGNNGPSSSAHYADDPLNAGAVHMKRLGARNLNLKQDNLLTAGNLYQLSYEIPAGSTVSGTGLRWNRDGVGSATTTLSNTVGSHSYVGAVTTDDLRIDWGGSSDGETTLTNIQVAQSGGLSNWDFTGENLGTSNYISPSVNASSSIVGARFVNAAGDKLHIYQGSTFASLASPIYKLVYDVVEYTSGQPQVFATCTSAGVASDPIDLATSVSSDNVAYFTAGDDGFAIGCKESVANDFGLANIRVYLGPPDNWVKAAGTWAGDETASYSYFAESIANPGRLLMKANKSDGLALKQTSVMEASKIYRFNYTVGTTTGGTALQIQEGGGTLIKSGLDTTAGAKSSVITNGASNTAFRIAKFPSSATGVSIELDDFSLNLLEGPDDWTVTNDDEDNYAARYGTANELQIVGEASPGTPVQISQAGVLTASATYFLRYTVVANAGGGANPLVWVLGGTTQNLAGTVGSHSYSVTNTSGNTDFVIKAATGAAVDIVLDSVQCNLDLGRIELPNPKFGNLDVPRRLQTGAESLGGEFFVYDRGVERTEYQFSWDALSKTQLDSLFLFFQSVEGMKETFTAEFDDWRPTEFGGTGGVITLAGVRFATASIEFEELRNAMFAVSVVLRDN